MRIPATILLIAFLLAATSAFAWQEVRDVPFEERGDQTGLLLALDRQEAYLQTQQGAVLRVGDLRVPAVELLRGVQLLRKIVAESFGKPEFSKRVGESFRVFRTSHPQFPGRAHFTAYYDPILEASRHASGPFRYPIYARPPDFVEQNGRCKMKNDGRQCWSREEIEAGNALAGKGLEIAWVKDYVDLHFTHIQGSGILRFPDGVAKTLHVTGTNGYAFSSPGRMLIAAGLSTGDYQQVKRVLKSDLALAMKYLRQNPRFIFFSLDDKPPSGSAGIPITPGRTIATDKSLYAAGAVGYVRYDAPKLDPSGKVAGYVSTSRFVVDNDTGSAIVGPGRADLYVGNGPRAEILAGATNTKGELYYLIPR